MRQKRAVTIQDISCYGRCSLTVALPILSAAGIETCAIPTAVLSTHTGGFTGYTYCDLTDQIAPISDHWKSLGIKFDAVYTGYLGSFEQIKLISDFFDRFGTEDCTVMIDPVMADNGVLYGGFDPDFPKGMARLAEKADVLVPNLTEAAFMLGEKYVGSGYSPEYIEGLSRRLSSLGPKTVVLTGISFEPGKLGASAYEADTGKISYCFSEYIDGYFHGTGDVFASALLAALVNGLTPEKAAEAAVNFTIGSIRRTFKAKTEPRCGVNFEEGLSELIKTVRG